MAEVSRNDLYMRDERGPEWFDEFLRSLANSKESSSVQDILNAIHNKRGETVESVVRQYREQVGLDIVQSADTDDKSSVKQASAKVRPLSIRHASGLGPIAPMKLKKLKDPDGILKNHDDSEIIVQIKLDGFKTQAIKDNAGAVKLYTRRGEDFTSNVPSLVKDLESKMKNGSFLLGELVWEDSKGKQSISDIQTVVGSSPEKAQEKIKDGGKMVFYVYDLLWDGGKDITKQKYIDRYNKLKSLVGSGAKTISVVKNYTYADKDKAIEDALGVNAEGIVLKPKDSEYKYAAKGAGEPTGEWAKFKPGAKAKTDEVILNKYQKAKDKFVFPMYQHKGSELFEVGKLSGMSKEDEAKIKKDIDGGKSVVVEITFQERMPSGKFRHVGWSRFRPDKSAKEVKTSEACFRPLSVRHAEQEKSIIEKIKSNPELVTALESLCRHSGGTIKLPSLMNFLRSELGKEVSFSDSDLKEYLSDLKSRFAENVAPEGSSEHVGLVGLTDDDNYDDDTADYATYDGAKH